MAKKEPVRNRYVGHRYVPMIFGEWDNTQTYEGLSVVLHQGNSYTSTGRVPVGIPITNEQFWKVTGNYNVQVEEYRQDVKRVNDELDTFKELTTDQLHTVMDNTLFVPMKEGDNTVDIQKAVNVLSADGGGTLLLDTAHTIDGTVSIPSNIVIKPRTRTEITSTISNFTPIFRVERNTENVSIEGFRFNLNDQARNAIMVMENVTNLVIDLCRFENFKGDGMFEMIVIRLKSGIAGTLKNLSFTNIKTVGNGVVGDGEGAGRCIKTETTGVEVLKNYQLTIDNLSFENCYNITASGNVAIEDFDVFHFQHNLVDGFINVSNISAKNINKRLFKFQAKGVNVINVNVDSIHKIEFLFGIMSDNINISNCIVKGEIKNVLEIVDAANVKCTNINAVSTFRGTGSTDSLVAIYNSKNVLLKGITLNGNGGILLYGKTLQNINIEDVNATVYDRILYMEDRNLAGTPYTDGVISGVTFKNIDVVVPSTTRQGALIEIRKGTTGRFDPVNMSNVRIEMNPVYLFGYIALRNVDVIIEDFLINDLSSLVNPEIIRLNMQSNIHLIRAVTKGNPTTKAVSVQDTSKLIVNRGNVSSLFIVGQQGTVELEKSAPTVSYNSGSTNAQITTVF